jgi:hypothetical protein
MPIGAFPNAFRNCSSLSASASSRCFSWVMPATNPWR